MSLWRLGWLITLIGTAYLASVFVKPGDDPVGAALSGFLIALGLCIAEPSRTREDS